MPTERISYQLKPNERVSYQIKTRQSGKKDTSAAPRPLRSMRKLALGITRPADRSVPRPMPGQIQGSSALGGRSSGSTYSRKDAVLHCPRVVCSMVDPCCADSVGYPDDSAQASYKTNQDYNNTTVTHNIAGTPDNSSGAMWALFPNAFFPLSGSDSGFSGIDFAKYSSTAGNATFVTMTANTWSHTAKFAAVFPAYPCQHRITGMGDEIIIKLPEMNTVGTLVAGYVQVNDIVTSPATTVGLAAATAYTAATFDNLMVQRTEHIIGIGAKSFRLTWKPRGVPQYSPTDSNTDNSPRTQTGWTGQYALIAYIIINSSAAATAGTAIDHTIGLNCEISTANYNTVPFDITQTGNDPVAVQSLYRAQRVLEPAVAIASATLAAKPPPEPVWKPLKDERASNDGTIGKLLRSAAEFILPKSIVDGVYSIGHALFG